MKATFVAPLVIGFAAATLLTACSNPLEGAANSLIAGGLEQAVEGASGADVDLNLDGSGASLPADWPSDISVPDGNIVFSVSQDGTTMFQMTVAGPEALDQMVANFKSAGFTETETGDMGGIKIYILERDGMGATASLIDLDGEYALQTSVTVTDD